MTEIPLQHYHDHKYIQLVLDVLANGVEKTDRTGTGTISTFARQMRFDLSSGSIPLLTTKKMHVRSVIHEILWYLQGNTNIKYLNDNKVTIWDEWADERGELGPVYGAQWRRWPAYRKAETPKECETYEKEGWTFVGSNNLGTYSPISDGYDSPTWNMYYKEIDQISRIVDLLKNRPDDRRIIVNAWNVGELDEMALPPCHYAFQFWVGNGRLSCVLNQRSCDVGLGVPFNIVQYSILTHMIAQVTNLELGEFVWNGGDVHIYKNHVDPLKEQISRTPYSSPRLKLNPDVKSIFDFRYEDFKILDYNSHPPIKMEVSV